VKEEKINIAYHQRLMMWICAFDMAKEAPLIGKGWGSYQLNYAPCQGKILLKHPQIGVLRTQANAAHNEFMEVLAQSGFTGLVLYLMFFAVFVYLFAASLKNMQPSARLFYCALFAGLAAMLADNMLNITMQTVITAFAFWFVVSAALGPASRECVKKVPLWLCIILLAACSALSGAVIMWQVIKIKSEAYDLKSLKAAALGNYRLSLDWGLKALTKANINAEIYYLLVNNSISLKNTTAAMQYAEDGIKYLPHYHEFYFKKAAIHASQGENETALKSLTKVLNLYPAYYPAAELYGQLLRQNRALVNDKTLKLFEDVSKTTTFTNTLKVTLSDILYQKGEMRKARQFAREALAADNLNPDAIALLLKINNNLGITQDALLKKAQMVAAIKESLKDVSLLPADFEKDMQAVILQHFDDLALNMLLAEFYFKSGSPSAAIEVLLGLYPLNGNDIALNFAIASAFTMVGQDKRAEPYLKRILALNPLNRTARQRLDELNLE
jgi:tetratricopeptide (TPR) repeat protein